MGFFKVNTLLLPLKVHYFLFMAGLASALPFRTIFAKQLGISATAVGIIFLAIPFFKILTNPLFGFLVDQFKKFRLTIAVLMAIVSVTHVAMVMIPPLENSEELAKTAGNLHTTAVYSCSTPDHEPYLHIYSELQTENGNNTPTMSCEVKCQEKTSVSSKTKRCENIAGILQMELKLKDYHFSISLNNESLVTVGSSSRKLVTVADADVNQLKSIHCSEEKGCFTKQNDITSQTNSSQPLGDNLIFNRTSNSTIGDNETMIYHKFTSRNVFAIGKLDGEETNCSCAARLDCVTTKCSYITNEEDFNEFLSFQFWSLFILMAVSSTAFCAVLFLIDAVCYEMLGNKKEDFGLQRLWGTVGWGLGALAGGYLNQLISPDSYSIDYSLSFYLLAVLVMIDLIPVYKLKVEDIKYSSNICKDVCFLLLKFNIFINVVMAFTIGVLSGLIWNYQFWFMEEIGSSQMLLGLSQTVECLFAELPCFFISGWVIKKIGYENCNSLTFLCFGLRYLCFAYMWNPWMSLPVALIAGPTFGIFYAALTMFGKTEAPPGTEATVQSLLAMAFEGVGAGTGCILGGVGFDKFGSRTTFLYSSIASFALLGINVLLHIFVLRRTGSKSTSKVNQPVNEKIDACEIHL